jgi:hypothetical protein
MERTSSSTERTAPNCKILVRVSLGFRARNSSRIAPTALLLQTEKRRGSLDGFAAATDVNGDGGSVLPGEIQNQRDSEAKT